MGYSNRILIVVDMQNDFVTGALGNLRALDIVPKVREKIEEYTVLGGSIVFTRDTHTTDYLQTHEGLHLPVEHCIVNTYGWWIHGGLDALAGPTARIINKSAFGYIDWLGVLPISRQQAVAGHGVGDTCIELVGLCTDICVISNALILKALYPEIPIYVDAECCAGSTPANHVAALQVMKACQVNVMNMVEAVPSKVR